MKVMPIVGTKRIYSSNVYLVMGDWKRIEDMTTLVDVGNDPSIIDIISSIHTGIGKNKVDQVVLTHDHSDHSGILPQIKAAFHPKVYAFSPFLEGVDHLLQDGDILRLGDQDFEVLHTPGHSSDSICLYNPDHGDLFVGDTPVVIRSKDGEYEETFYQSLLRLCRRQVNTIYFGHGEPQYHKAQETLLFSLQNVRNSIQK
jgi:glyoxylase-like metal-dependent hydrolase (beta-lactamase superfamily II)